MLGAGGEITLPVHPRLATFCVAAYDRKLLARGRMRFIFGMIVGALLTIGGAYVADTRVDALPGGRMVNGAGVGERVSERTADLRRYWDDFPRRFTGPP